jgi:hypothetical protein
MLQTYCEHWDVQWFSWWWVNWPKTYQINGNRSSNKQLKLLTDQCLKWASIWRYTILELLFVLEFHTGTYQYMLYPFIFYSIIMPHNRMLGYNLRPTTLIWRISQHTEYLTRDKEKQHLCLQSVINFVTSCSINIVFRHTATLLNT